MNIGTRLEAIGNLVPLGAILADIGTDHAYLPVYLLEKKKIVRAIAGDIAAGPCQAAHTTIAMYNKQQQVEVRQGSGLSVLKPGEADCITLAGMGGSTMVEILAADMVVAMSARRLILQPQTGALGLRTWLLAHGWYLITEELVWENKHLYEIMVAERGAAPRCYTDAELEIGPLLLEKRHHLLADQFKKVLGGYSKQMTFMAQSAKAVQSAKYKHLQTIVSEMEALRDACNLE